jgi:hypothetical protein
MCPPPIAKNLLEHGKKIQNLLIAPIRYAEAFFDVAEAGFASGSIQMIVSRKFRRFPVPKP